jgi:predicted metalloprotease with PDZ domain
MHTAAIGPYSWEAPLVAMSHATQGGLASRDYAGNIGNQVLERFTVTFDYGRRTVWLEPGRRFSEPDRFSLAGVQLAKQDGIVRALQVLPGSAAAAAGIEEGDEVRKLDGRPIAEWTLDQVTTLFEDGKPGDKHTLEIARAGRKKKITLVLREIL